MVNRSIHNALPMLWIVVFNFVGSMVGLAWGGSGLVHGMTAGMMVGAATLPFAIQLSRRSKKFSDEKRNADTILGG